MSYSKVIFLTLSVGFGGYICKAIKNNQNGLLQFKTKSQQRYQESNDSNVNSKSNSDSFWRNIVRVSAKPDCPINDCPAVDYRQMNGVNLVNHNHVNFPEYEIEDEDEFEHEDEVERPDYVDEDYETDTEDEDEPDGGFRYMFEYITRHYKVATEEEFRDQTGCDETAFGRITANPITPTRTALQLEGNMIVADTRTKTPGWCYQKISRPDLNRVEHQHWEALDFKIRGPPGLVYGNPCNQERLDIEAVIRPNTHLVNGVCVCDMCKKTKFWEVFHQYIKYLLRASYCVYVCSGTMFLNEACPRKPTHFFKAIACQNPDNSYRVECYKIPIPRRQDRRIPNLHHFFVTRDRLETDTGIKVFDKIPNSRIRQDTTDPEFTYEAPGQAVHH